MESWCRAFGSLPCQNARLALADCTDYYIAQSHLPLGRVEGIIPYRAA